MARKISSHFISTMASPRPHATIARPPPPTMPAKLGASPLLSPEAAHAQLPGADALASAFSGLESATTEWPDLEIWPTGPAALDAGWDEVMAPWPREDALTKARSDESLVAVEGAPTCAQNCHPPTGRPDPALRLLLNFTVNRAADAQHVVEGWGATASHNQCCKGPSTARECEDVQASGQTSTRNVQDLNNKDGRSPVRRLNKHGRSPRLHSRQRQYARTIASATALRLLHIPRDMHRQLGLGSMYPKKAAGRRKNVCTVDLVTGTAHAAVMMLRTTSKGQHHRRLSTGWREFCGLAGVGIGDRLVFTRLENANTLSVHIEKKAE